MIPARFDHVHLRSADPAAAARFYCDLFGARLLDELQVRGVRRAVLDLGGLRVFIEEVAPSLHGPPPPPFRGLEHLGLCVPDLDAALATLAAHGIAPVTAVEQVNPALRIVFLEGPDQVRIELLERKPA